MKITKLPWIGKSRFKTTPATPQQTGILEALRFDRDDRALAIELPAVSFISTLIIGTIETPATLLKKDEIKII